MTKKDIKILDLAIKKVLLSRLRNKNTTQKYYIETMNRLCSIFWEWVLSDKESTYI